MKIVSTAFNHNAIIPSKYTCDGEDVNPPLRISEVPAKAQSLVLIMDDPDAPAGTWVHWTVYNIDPYITIEIKENSVPEQASEGMTSFGRAGYGGPCPPSGTHRYFFKLYALDIKYLPSFETPPNKANVESAMRGHIIESAELIGLYSRD